MIDIRGQLLIAQFFKIISDDSLIYGNLNEEEDTLTSQYNIIS